VKSHLWITVSVFVIVFVTSALALTVLLISQHKAYNVLPSSIQETKAIKPKTSPPHVPPPNNGSTIPPSSQSNTAPPSGCINYNPSTRTITISCNSARLTDIDNKLHDSSVLAKQSPKGIWFLNANLLIAKGAVFHMDPTDVKWLKINSKAIRSLARILHRYTRQHDD
jgi:hypothetical protein